MADKKKQQQGAGLRKPTASKGQADAVRSRGQQSKKHRGGGDPSETEEHAKEVRALMSGQDFVQLGDRQADLAAKPPPAFDREDLKVVRSWLADRPLEPRREATTMIPYPRMWNTKRGRYCKFQAPGAGVYGILRARPSF